MKINWDDFVPKSKMSSPVKPIKPIPQFLFDFIKLLNTVDDHYEMSRILEARLCANINDDESDSENSE